MLGASYVGARRRSLLSLESCVAGSNARKEPMHLPNRRTRPPVNAASRRAFLMAGGAAGFATVGILTSPARAAQYEFRCTSDLPADHPSSLGMVQMWKAIERESGGRIHTQLFTGGQLGGAAATLSQVRLGAIQFFIGGGVVSGVIPTWDITNIGFAFKDGDGVFRAMDGQLGAYIGREGASKGLHVLHSVWDSGMRDITTSSHPIRTADDMPGFKIRVVASKIIVDLFKTLGASPAPLSLGETYTALQTKVVDGQDTPLVTIETSRYYEVQKYLSLTDHNWSGLLVVANADLWKNLPSDLQTIIERNNTKYALIERHTTRIVNLAMADKLARQGLTVNTAEHASFQARLHPYYATWAREFGPMVWGLLEESIGTKLG